MKLSSIALELWSVNHRCFDDFILIREASHYDTPQAVAPIQLSVLEKTALRTATFSSQTFSIT